MGRETIHVDGIFGGKDIIYENGEKVAESYHVNGIFGGHRVTVDTKGDVISKTYEASGIGGKHQRTEHSDGTVSKTYEMSTIFGKESVTFSNDKQVSSSHHKNGSFGGSTQSESRDHRIHADSFIKTTESKKSENINRKPEKDCRHEIVGYADRQSNSRESGQNTIQNHSEYTANDHASFSVGKPMQNQTRETKEIEKRIKKLKYFNMFDLQKRLLNSNEYPEVKLAILKKLQGKNLNFNFVMLNDSDPEVRYTALCYSKGVSESSIEKLAMCDSSPKVRAYALSLLKSDYAENIFRSSIISAFYNTEVVLAALEGLSDECFEIKLLAESHPHMHVRIEAIKKIMTQPDLLSLFSHEKDLEVKYVILNKLNKESLIMLLENHGSEARKAAIKKLKNMGVKQIPKRSMAGLINAIIYKIFKTR